ncbi:hypothetical protein ACHAW6_002421 [Cyclotella cf. meneghiniana]
MVMVEIDSNAILLELLKNRTDGEMIRTYNNLVSQLLRCSAQPKKHILDNEISTNMKHHVQDKYKFTVKLVLPGCHCHNAAKVTIRNFKPHFFSVLAGVADSFPHNLWDRVLPQTEVTLKLLWESNAKPHVSAYTHVCGPFDYSKMLLAPMGCEVQIHKQMDKCSTWAFHCLYGWYLNTSSDHYCVHNCHMKSTKAERLSDTGHFHHKTITKTTLTLQAKLMQALANCKAALAGLISSPAHVQANDLCKLIDLTEAFLTPTEQLSTTNRQPGLPTLWVHSITQDNPRAVPRVPPSTTPIPRVVQVHDLAQHTKSHQCRIHKTTPPIFLSLQPPALSIHSHV